MYLVAWRAGGLAGRCTVLTASKYDKVRRLLGAFPEMNALEARPPGQDTGTKIIACAEHMARERGAGLSWRRRSLHGLAVVDELRGKFGGQECCRISRPAWGNSSCLVLERGLQSVRQESGLPHLPHRY